MIRKRSKAVWCLLAAVLLAGPPWGKPAAAAAADPTVMAADLLPIASDLAPPGSGKLRIDQQIDSSTGWSVFAWGLNLTDVQGLTKAHLHVGAPGQAGPLAVVLLPNVAGANYDSALPEPLSGNLSFSGTFAPSAFLNTAQGMTAEGFTALVANNSIYAIIHTVNQTNGAARGQLEVVQGGAPVPAPAPPAAAPPPPAISQSLVATLAPPEGSTETGSGTYSLRLASDGTTFGWVLDLRNIHEMTRVHLHDGDPSSGGALVVGLLPNGTESARVSFNPPLSGDWNFEGKFTSADFSSSLAGQPADALLQLATAGRLFLNVHTLSEPLHAISGRLVPADPPTISPTTPPGNAPAPPPGTGTTTDSSTSSSSSSSSVPIGAIVGGVVGGIAIIAVAAGLFLWSRKRRQRSAAGPLAADSDGGGSSTFKKRPSVAGGRGSHSHDAPPAQVTDTFLTGSMQVVPVSTHSSHLSAPSTVRAPKHLLDSDPLLSYISSHLSSQRGGGSEASGSVASRTGGASTATTRRSSSLRPELYQQLVLDWKDLHIEEAIGTGSFGRVYLARYFSTPVAVKVLMDRGQIDASNMAPPSLLRSLEEETRIMSRIRHPNVIQLIGICEMPACIITEYCQHGSLYDVLRRGATDPQHAARLTWRLRLRMAIDAATGMLFLHSRVPSIIHRDLKSPNLLVDKNFDVKVGDFNLSKILEEQYPGAVSAGSSLGGANNPLWLAPEVLRGDKPTAASDVFSFGVIMYELLTWQLPWAGMSTFKIMQAVLDGQRLMVPPAEALPGVEGPFAGLEAYCQLMRACWADDPAQRPAFDAVIARLEELLPLTPAAAVPATY